MTEKLYSIIQMMDIEFIDLIEFASVFAAATTWVWRRQNEDVKSGSTCILGKTFARISIWAVALGLLTWVFFVSTVANNAEIDMSVAWNTADQWLSTLVFLLVAAAQYWLLDWLLHSKAWKNRLSVKYNDANRVGVG